MEHATCVSSHRTSILTAAEEQLHDVPLNGTARAGEGALSQGRKRAFNFEQHSSFTGH